MLDIPWEQFFKKNGAEVEAALIFDCDEGRETLDEFLKLRGEKDMIIAGISSARTIIEDLKMVFKYWPGLVFEHCKK